MMQFIVSPFSTEFDYFQQTRQNIDFMEGGLTLGYFSNASPKESISSKLERLTFIQNGRSHTDGFLTAAYT